MTKRIKTVIAVAITVLLLLTVTSCGIITPYDKYDEEGYSVSVKYDANGGSFTTNTTVIVDTTSLDSLKTNADGMKELPLISPSDPNRGQGNAFTPTKSGYFLAGWYTERTAVTDNGNVLDIDGNIQAETGKEIAYTYSGKWNFGDKYLIDPDAEYTASEPVITLYAAWVPEFKYEFYNADGTELLGSVSFNPTVNNTITLPEWDLDNGILAYNGIPEINGKTYVSLSTEIGGEAYVGTTLTHTGVFNPADATAENNVMKVYLELAEGKWYRIFTAQQFIKNAAANGCYYIEQDLDFGGKWTAAFQNKFTGKIIGNGHTFYNVAHKQNSAALNNALFGQIDAKATIENLTFVNATYTITKGSTTQGASFGLLAGVIAEGATVTGVSLTDSTIIIEAGYQLNFPKNYNFNLVAGLGSSYADVTLNTVGVMTTEYTVGSTTYYVEVAINHDNNDVTVTTGKRTETN